jgi:outer membrane protein assembly factor BamB
VYTCDTPLVSSPAIGADGALYFAKGETDTLDSYKLIALSPDGSLRWEYYPDGYGFTSPPTIDANGTLYIGIGGALHAVNPDGTRKWTFEDPAGKVAGVAIGTDGTLYFGESEGKVYALGPGRG